LGMRPRRLRDKTARRLRRDAGSSERHREIGTRPWPQDPTRVA
jgi:hypothetical protein